MSPFQPIHPWGVSSAVELVSAHCRHPGPRTRMILLIRKGALAVGYRLHQRSCSPVERPRMNRLPQGCDRWRVASGLVAHVRSCFGGPALVPTRRHPGGSRPRDRCPSFRTRGERARPEDLVRAVQKALGSVEPRAEPGSLASNRTKPIVRIRAHACQTRPVPAHPWATVALFQPDQTLCTINHQISSIV